MALAFVIVALVALLDPLRQVIDAFWELAHGAQVRPPSSLVLKAVGVAYLTSIGAELARDAARRPSAPSWSLRGRCRSSSSHSRSSPRFSTCS